MAPRVSHRHILSGGGGNSEVGYNLFRVAWSLWCLFNDRTRLDDATNLGYHYLAFDGGRQASKQPGRQAGIRSRCST